MSMYANINALADGVYDALIRDDIPRAMHLSWRLMQQQGCPLQLQAQAVLVHSGASLSMGGDVAIIEGNLQNMIKRMRSILSQLPLQGAEAPQVIRALHQLRAAATSIRPFSRHPPSNVDLDLLAKGFGKMGLGMVMDDDEEEEEEEGGLRQMRRRSYSHSSWRRQATCA